MSERLQLLVEERNRDVGAIRAIFDKAETEAKGILSPEQDDELKKLETNVDALKDRIDREQRQLDREKELRRFVDDPISQDPNANTPKDADAETRKLNDKKMKFFRSWLVDGNAAKFHPEYRDIVAGTASQGGYLATPTEFVAKLIQAVDNAIILKKLATTIPMPKAQSLGFPTLDTDVADAEWTTELATGSATSFTVGKRELSPWPLAKRIKASNTILAVSAIPIEDLVNQRFSYKFNVAVEKALMQGTGASQPLGLFTNSANGLSSNVDVTAASATTIVFDDLIKLQTNLKAAYYAKAAFMFHRTAIRILRLVKDTQGHYIWNPAVVAGQPDSLLGFPFYVSEYVPNTFTSGKYVGIFGDFSYYWVAQVMDFAMKRLDELYAETNEVGWIGRMELDGMPVLEEAFSRLVLA